MDRLLEQLLSQKWTALEISSPFVEQGEWPGIYLLAFTRKDLRGKDIDLSEVFYVGMSNARRGVNGRLKQFVGAIEGKPVKHVAGKRFFTDKRWGNGTPYSKLGCKEGFYVTGITVQCQVRKGKRGPEDLRKMGDVAALEYYVLAAVREAANREPPLNVK